MNFYEFQKIIEKDMKEFFQENGMPIKVKINTVKKVGMRKMTVIREKVSRILSERMEQKEYMLGK